MKNLIIIFIIIMPIFIVLIFSSIKSVRQEVIVDYEVTTASDYFNVQYKDVESIIELSDGGRIYITENDNVIKKDINEQTIWTISKEYFGINQRPTDVYEMEDKSLIITTEGNDSKIFKFSSGGERLWERTIISEKGFDIYDCHETGDDKYIFVGEYYLYDGFILVMDNKGNIITKKIIEDFKIHNILRVDDGYILSGIIRSSGHENAYITKTDDTGNKSWEKRIPISHSSYEYIWQYDFNNYCAVREDDKEYTYDLSINCFDDKGHFTFKTDVLKNKDDSMYSNGYYLDNSGKLVIVE